MTETTHEALVRQTGAVEELMDYYQGSRAGIQADRAAHNADVVAHKLAMQAQVDGFFEAIATGISSLHFDNTLLYSKAALSIPAHADHVDRTEWVYLAAIQNTVATGRMAGTGVNVVDLQRAYVTQPGAYDDPPYSVDFSKSTIEMVLAPSGTHLEVEASIAAAGIAHDQIGGWNSGSFNRPIQATSNSYCKLWFRFANRHTTTGDYSGQAIDTFGGNTGFAINAVHTFTNP